MKNYAKPTLEIAKITTNEAIAAGTPVINSVGVQKEGEVTVTVYELSYVTASSDTTGA